MSPLQGVDESLGLGGRQTDEGDGFSGEGFDVRLSGRYQSFPSCFLLFRRAARSIFNTASAGCPPGGVNLPVERSRMMPRLLKAALLARGALFYFAIVA